MADLPILYDVNLPGLTARELHGPWKLTCLRQALASEPFWAEATYLELQDDTFRLHAAAALPHEGTWHLQRHSRLGQPFLALYLPEAPAQALITRLRRSADGEVRQMVLYFQSGLELQLTHP